MSEGLDAMPGEAPNREPHLFTREEVAKHCKPDDLWLVLNGKVYDVTRWAGHHPGGKAILLNHGGDDASEAFDSFHVSKDMPKRYLKSFEIGRLTEDDCKVSDIVRDFRTLREDLKSKGYFTVNPQYYIVYSFHCLSMAVLAALLLWYFKTNWPAWILATLLTAACYLHVTSLVHDSAHLSMSPSTQQNHWICSLAAGLLLGVSGQWFKHKHNLHHSRTNVYNKDPDVTVPFDFFVFGDEVAVDMARKGQSWMPYHWQHFYFLVFGTPTFFTCYAPVEALLHTIKFRVWGETLQLIVHYFGSIALYNWLIGNLWSAVAFHFTYRILVSHWWIWVTQTSHVPMSVRSIEKHPDWATQQINSTCNTESSAAVDWFMVHVNFQIEHHFFPTMPRQHFHAVAPYVEKFCKRHNLHYTVKPNPWTAMKDVFRAIRRSGKVWLEECMKLR